MSVLVDIFKIPEPVEKDVPVISLRGFQDVPFLEEGFLQHSVDLNELVTGNRGATFYAKVSGNCSGSTFKKGDVLVVDRSWPMQINKLAVCSMGGEFVLKMIRQGREGIYLESVNGSEPPIVLTDENQFLVWGLVTYELKRLW